MDHSQHAIHDHDAHNNHKVHQDTIMQNNDLNSIHTHMGHETHNHSELGNMMHHVMSMSFHFGTEETILFSWWKTNSVLGLIGSCLAIFLMATLYEGLKYYREYLFWKTYNLLEYRPVSAPEKANETRSSNTVHYVGEVIHKQPPSMFSVMHIYQTFLHIIQVTLSFLLMLIFMTYNVWLCIAVVIGAALGYFLFCWKKSVIVDVTEHCH